MHCVKTAGFTVMSQPGCQVAPVTDCNTVTEKSHMGDKNTISQYIAFTEVALQ